MTHDSNTDPSRIVRALRELLELVAAEDQRHQDGATALGRTRLGYEFSIGTGNLSEFEPDPNRPPNTSPTNRPTAVRYEDGDVLVTIDIPKTDPERVSAGVTDDELLLGIDGTIEERISLGQSHLEIATTTVTNGILEFRLRPMEEIQE